MQKTKCMEWKTVEKRVIFRNKYIGLRNDKAQRPDGKIVDYVVVENHDFCSVVAKGWCYLYYAELGKKREQSLDPNEFIEVKCFNNNEIYKLQNDVQIIHAPSLLGLNLAENRKYI